MIDRLFPYVLLFIGISLLGTILMSCERIEPNKNRKSQIVMLAGV